MNRRLTEKAQSIHPREAITAGRLKAFGVLSVLVIVAAIPAPAQDKLPPSNAVSFATLLNFDGTNDSYPSASFVQGLDGDLYGSATIATFSDGSIFKITPAGALTTLFDFCKTDCDDGEITNSLVLATDGNFYGTTYFGGSGATCPNTAGCGAFFKMTPDGTLTTLYSFCSQTNCADGANPYSALIQATDGDFYGTAQGGGINNDGTIFKLTPQGALTLLHTFDFNDGAYPTSTLVRDAVGNFYGSAFAGGDEGNGLGVVFKITPNGAFTVLHSFNGTDGSTPTGALVETDGKLFGTTSYGGNGLACPSSNGCGTFFMITPSGELATLYSFCSRTNCTDGNYPFAPIILGTDGYFYGTTQDVTTNGHGTIFKVSRDGVLTTLHSFDGNDGYFPNGLFQATNGSFYGTAGAGGTGNYGTVFSLSVGLRPFVETVPISGKVGDTVMILGNDLVDATHVFFNHTEAAFKVVSSSEIQTTVPAGATTGLVAVTRRGPRLSSNVQFQVRP